MITNYLILYINLYSIMLKNQNVNITDKYLDISINSIKLLEISKYY